MRTYLTRLSAMTAGVVLTGLSLTGVAHAGEGDDNTFLDPSVLEDIPPLEPCHEVTASEDMVLIPLDANEPHTPLPPGEIELVPCYQLPTDPGDEDEDDDGNGGDGDGGDGGDGGNGGGGQGPGGDNGGGGDGDNSGDGGNSAGGDGQSSGGSNDQPDGEPSGDPTGGGGDESLGETTDDGTSQPQATVTRTAASGHAGDGALMLAILAGVLGALGLFLLTYGLRRRPRRGQLPAR